MTKLLAKAALMVMVFTLIAGIGALVTGISSYRQSRKAKPQPQVISAAKLAEHGPGDNHYVQLTDFVPRLDSIVVEGGNRKTNWDTAYIPLASTSDDIDSDDPPRLVLVSTTVKDQPALDALPNTHTLVGMVSPWNLDDQTKGMLKKSYPKLDTAKCYVLRQDETPPSKSGSLVCITIGVGLLAFTLLLGTVARGGKWGEQLAAKQSLTFGTSPFFQPPAPIRFTPIATQGGPQGTGNISPFVANLRKKVGTDLLMLTGINAVVLNDRRQILLVRSKESGHWMPIGGMIEPGEEPANAAIREVFEETGIRVRPEKLAAVYDGPAVEYSNGDRVHYITIVFLCKAAPGAPYPQDGENSEVRYFELDQIPPMRQDYERNVHDALAGRAEAAFHVKTT